MTRHWLKPLPGVLMGAALLFSARAFAQASPSDISVIYTGKSLGALGVLRDPDEQDLLFDAADKLKATRTVTSYTCWRAPGVVIFDPSGDLAIEDLPAFLASAPALSPVGDKPILRSNNITMLQDPAKATPDLLALTLGSEKAKGFPDLQQATGALSTTKSAKGKELMVLVENGAALPTQAGAWTEGQVSRIEINGGVVYSLPVNLAEFGPRAGIVERLAAEARAAGGTPVIVDLGMRDGDMGMARADRARIDYGALKALGYTLVVPYQLELLLTTKDLEALAKESGIQLLAANLKPAAGDDIFKKSIVVEVNGAQVGFIGLVDPEVKGKLSKPAYSALTFEDPVAAAKREVQALRDAGAEAVVILSNMHPKENALVAREVVGIDAIVGDLHTRWSPESLKTSVTLPDRPLSRPGSPALVARSFGNGLGVGKLDLDLQASAAGGQYLAGLSHALESVTDRSPSDAVLVEKLRQQALDSKRPRGDVLISGKGKLERIDKGTWESFLARLIRRRSGAEVSFVHKLDNFPPNTGELDEADIRTWLWTEESIVVVDLSGKDLKAVLAANKGDMVVDGVVDGKVHDLAISDNAFYRVATTDFLLDEYGDFGGGKRIRKGFRVREDGTIRPVKEGGSLQVRDYVIDELRRMKRFNAEEELVDLFDADETYEPTFTFTFDHVTLFGSLNQAAQGLQDGYATVADTRVNAPSATVIGVTGNYLFAYDVRKVGVDFGVNTAFSNQIQRDVIINDEEVDLLITETADDLKFNTKLRFKLAPGKKWNPQPFLGAVFDSEFSPVVQADGTENPRQLDLSGLTGVTTAPSDTWTKLQPSAIFTQSFTGGINAFKLGLNLETEYKKALPKLGKLSFRWTNNASYFPVIPTPNPAGLRLRYNAVFEFLLPFLEDLSASFAIDALVFQGEISEDDPAVDGDQTNDDLGATVIFRAGLTYDRFWKPKYQSLF